MFEDAAEVTVSFDFFTIRSKKSQPAYILVKHFPFKQHLKEEMEASKIMATASNYDKAIAILKSVHEFG